MLCNSTSRVVETLESDGTGSIILCDEDPVGNICTNGFDDDKDGLVDAADSDNDGDADCLSDDDDGDGIVDEDVLAGTRTVTVCPTGGKPPMV